MRTRAMLTSDHFYSLGFPGGASGKEYAGQSGDVRDAGSIPGSGRCPGEENDNPLQYACLVNLMDRGAWQAIVHGVAKNQTRLKQPKHKLVLWN